MITVFLSYKEASLTRQDEKTSLESCSYELLKTLVDPSSSRGMDPTGYSQISYKFNHLEVDCEGSWANLNH